MKPIIYFWSIFLPFLAVMCFHGSGTGEMLKEDDIPEGVNVLQLHSMDIGIDPNQLHAMEMEERLHGHGDHDHKGSSEETLKREEDTGDMHAHGHGHSSSSHMEMDDHLDPSAFIVFNLTDLKPGNTLPIYFEKQDRPPLLQSKEEADSIPFSSAQLPYLLEFFSYSPGSPQAKSMENTLTFCERGPLKGEIKFCATSKESMLDSVQTFFGQDSKYFRAYSTSYLSNNSTALLQNYTILEEPQIKEIPAHPKMLACHPLPYPYLIYYCHFPGGENKVFEVSLRGQSGDRVDALSICHFDTSSWSIDNVAFLVFGIRHGDTVCHFFPADNLIWLPN